jgi:hypothetical protein
MREDRGGRRMGGGDKAMVCGEKVGKKEIRCERT